MSENVQRDGLEEKISRLGTESCIDGDKNSWRVKRSRRNKKPHYLFKCMKKYNEQTLTAH